MGEPTYFQLPSKVHFLNCYFQSHEIQTDTMQGLWPIYRKKCHHLPALREKFHLACTDRSTGASDLADPLVYGRRFNRYGHDHQEPAAQRRCR